MATTLDLAAYTLGPEVFLAPCEFDKPYGPDRTRATTWAVDGVRGGGPAQPRGV